MSEKPRLFYEFGPFRLDEGERRLLRDGAEVRLRENGREEKLPPKAFDLLLFLAKQGGRRVERREILDEVWPETNVEPGRVDDNVSTLRKFLGDSAKAPRYIETVPKHGYRLTAEVREVREEGEVLLLAERTRARLLIEEADEGTPDGGHSPAGVVDSAPRPALAPAALAKRWPRARALAAACAGLAVLSFAAYYFTRGTGRPEGPRQQFKSLAVLPLNQLGAASGEDEYLGPGLADALITKLSNVRQIAVRPTSAVLKYAGPQPDLVAVGREQRVDAVLDGNFQRAGDRVRVTVQLVRAADGAPLWAGTFDERLTDIFALQDAVSARVADALELRLSGEETGRLARRPTENAEAYRLYLLGRYFWNKMTADGLREAIRYYSRAIELDPSYALAHAGVADAYNMLGIWDLLPQGEAFPRARAAALRALAIDDTLPEAHTALAYATFRHGWEWQAAEQGFRRAIELNPNYPAARQFYAEYLIASRRFDEALAELERVRELDPLSLYARMQAAVRLYFMRRYDEAVEQLRELVQMDSGYPIAYGLLWACYREQGMHAESVAAQLESLRLNGFDEGELNSLRAAFAASGPSGFWRREIELWKRRPESMHFSSIFIAMNYAQLGERDEAFAWLERARAARHGWLTELSADPVWDSLRDDPRFAQLVERVNIPR